VVISGKTIEAVAEARNQGVKGGGLDTALPEVQEKGGGVTPPPQTRLLKKLGGWIRAP